MADLLDATDALALVVDLRATFGRSGVRWLRRLRRSEAKAVLATMKPLIEAQREAWELRHFPGRRPGGCVQ